LEKTRRLIGEVDAYLERSWRAADLLANADEGDPAFAVQRAYYALYNVATVGATLLEIDLLRYQSGSEHHIASAAITHSRIPDLVRDIVNIIDPPKKLGAKQYSTAATSAFGVAKELRYQRMRADYIRILSIGPGQAREQIEISKALVNFLWSYCCEHR
jgi:hypothetical protein